MPSEIIDDLTKRILSKTAGKGYTVIIGEQVGTDLMGLPLAADIVVKNDFGHQMNLFLAGDNDREIPYLLYSVGELDDPTIIIYTGDARSKAFAWAREEANEVDQRFWKLSEFRQSLRDDLFE